MRTIGLLVLWVTFIALLGAAVSGTRGEVFNTKEVESLADKGMLFVKNSADEPLEIFRNNHDVKYLLCLNNKHTILYVYRVKKSTFHNRSSVLVRCRGGVFYISNSYI